VSLNFAWYVLGSWVPKQSANICRPYMLADTKFRFGWLRNLSFWTSWWWNYRTVCHRNDILHLEGACFESWQGFLLPWQVVRCSLITNEECLVTLSGLSICLITHIIFRQTDLCVIWYWGLTWKSVQKLHMWLKLCLVCPSVLSLISYSAGQICL
jgi:hypothetical protein